MPSYLMTFCSTARPEKRMSPHVPVPAFCEPGACSISCDIWRPLTGRPCTSRSLTLAPILRGADVEDGRVCRRTVTLSVTPAGLSSKSSVSSWPTATGICGYSIGAKPCFVTLIVYVDGFRPATRRSPAGSWSSSASSAVFSFFTVTGRIGHERVRLIADRPSDPAESDCPAASLGRPTSATDIRSATHPLANRHLSSYFSC